MEGTHGCSWHPKCPVSIHQSWSLRSPPLDWRSPNSAPSPVGMQCGSLEMSPSRFQDLQNVLQRAGSRGVSFGLEYSRANMVWLLSAMACDMLAQARYKVLFWSKPSSKKGTVASLVHLVRWLSQCPHNVLTSNDDIVFAKGTAASLVPFANAHHRVLLVSTAKKAIQ